MSEEDLKPEEEQPADVEAQSDVTDSDTAEEAAGEIVAENDAVEADSSQEERVEEVEEVVAEVEKTDKAEAKKEQIPGANLDVDIVAEGENPLGENEIVESAEYYSEESVEVTVVSEEAEDKSADSDEAIDQAQPIAQVEINLTKDVRYRATGKRKTSIARVILSPGSGNYTANQRELNDYFPRLTLQQQIKEPLELVGYGDKIDVWARIQGGGISSQADALRHGIAKALLEANPSLRKELKKRGFLTRDSRVKERRKAGFKKARKRPQFSKR